MPFDYRPYDLRNLFHLREVVLAWCDADEITVQNARTCGAMRWALVEAVSNGELPKQGEAFMKCDYAATQPPFDLAFKREDLKRWALSKGQKPKFLFPEERDVSDARDCQLDKARCQALAQLLWEMEPTRTTANMATDKRILKYGNGSQYGEKTLQAWLREVDPRAPEQKTGRPKKSAATG
jgi:hypothetical protein